VSAATVLPVSESFEEFLQQEQSKDLLRFTTAGSVDDGKSTLIGRLLYDSRSVYDDQLESVTKASAGRNAGAIDFSLLTDGLRAEREQGITIDVAYRYFATPRRKFIIADTPGHEQYTRNMVTGASTAELAIVLVDARKGLLPQSRRHAYIASLLGLAHVVIAVNKMDLVGYDRATFARTEADFRRFLSRFQSIEPYFVPISALAGDNVVTRSGNMPWFHGPSLLEYLERVPTGRRAQNSSFRFPVQRVVRPNQEFRGYAGTLVSGRIAVGDAVVISPSGRRTAVASITTFDGDLQQAQAGEAVTLTLADEVDVVRGDTISTPDDLPLSSNSINATLVWLNGTPAQVKTAAAGITNSPEMASNPSQSSTLKVLKLQTKLSREELLRLPGVQRVDGTNSSFAVTSSAPEATLRDLLSLDPSLEGLEVLTPALEDAFLALTAK